MPRQVRLDLEGCLYHVIGRGIERKNIFLEDSDRHDFIKRLGISLAKTKGQCLAWALLDNHFHLLIIRGEHPLALLMRSLMTGYALRFNRQHRRAGHLFQNRYKAILCSSDEYLMELIVYIHLNPLRANIVRDVNELESYPWSGHKAIVTGWNDTVLARDAALQCWGLREREAVKNYQAFVNERANLRPGTQIYSGGGLIRSLGGKQALALAGKSDKPECHDERILGNGNFVKEVLNKAQEQPRRDISADDVLEKVLHLTGANKNLVLSRAQERPAVLARALYCHWAKMKANVSGVFLAKQTGLSSGAISQLAQKGRGLAENWIVNL